MSVMGLGQLRPGQLPSGQYPLATTSPPTVIPEQLSPVIIIGTADEINSLPGKPHALAVVRNASFEKAVDIRYIC